MTKKKLADIKNPTIEAAINGLFKFAAEASAAKKIELIRTNFVVSKAQAQSEKPSVRLWVRGYDLSAKELEQGYVGNFAIISYAKNDAGKYALYVTKDIVELKLHPDKQRPVMRHPNWKHKILDAVSKKRGYASIEDANAALDLLLEEFPDITIPGMNKLYIMVYEKDDAGKAGVKKYLLRIKEHKAGGFIIEANLNEKKVKSAPPQNTEKPEAQGHFTKLILARRNKKR